IWFEQVPAPLDSRLNRLMPGYLHGATAQDGQASRDARCYVPYRQRPSTGRGQLDAQRNTVDGTAYLHHRSGLLWAQPSLAAASLAEQGDKQFDRVAWQAL